MKKNLIRSWIIYAIVMICYQVIVFVPPFPKNAVFWWSYAFSMLALLSQIYVFCAAFRGTNTVKSRFYGFPIVQVSVLYAAIQIVLGLVMMLLSQWIAVWIAVVLYVLLFGAAAIGVLFTESMRDEVQQQDMLLRQTTFFIREMTALTQGLLSQTNDPGLREKLRRLSEAVRYSDPVSAQILVPIEHELRVTIEMLQSALVDASINDAMILCDRAEAVLAERNRICKLNK